MDTLKLNLNTSPSSSLPEVERWGMIELVLPINSLVVPEDGLSVTFSHDGGKITIPGFCRNDTEFAVRFMPEFCGMYHYHIECPVYGIFPDGAFYSVQPSGDNHGPVRANGEHFVYADGKACYPFGTTCYAWLHQPEEIRRKTMHTLAHGYFNKIRFCVFPKHYIFNETDPDVYPFRRKNNSDKEYDWDWSAPDPEFFDKLDSAMDDLRGLGIEADIILFHPYDKWGFSSMPQDVNDFYLKYMVARYAAYRNVWWSLANEYDVMAAKTPADWIHYGELIRSLDYADHLRSVHNCVPHYDFSQEWVTHCSIQNQDRCLCGTQTDVWREQYKKPVVLDEIAYEGTIPYLWGCITGQELVRRFWETAIRGGYATHGETYLLDDGVIWWSHGGELHGDSGPRIAFLRHILEETPGNSMKKIVMQWDDDAGCAESDCNYMLFYFGIFRPSFRIFHDFDEDSDYHVELIDTWNMTIEDKGIHHGKFRLDMPGRQYMALRIVRQVIN